MDDLRLFEQGPVLAHVVHDRPVGLEDVHPGIVLDLGREPALLVHGRVDVEAVLDACAVVFLAVARGGVDRSRPSVKRHVIGQDEHRLPVDERMPGLEPLEVPALECCQELDRIEAQLLGQHGDQPLGGDEGLALPGLEGGILMLRMEGDGQVGRKRPRSRGPDDDRHPPALQGRVLLR